MDKCQKCEVELNEMTRCCEGGTCCKECEANCGPECKCGPAEAPPTEE